MSVDIAWDTISQGPDGEALAAKIRDFIHDKFQQVALPRFIKSVQVHSFEFGSECPVVEIKDISNPLPDFYEDDATSDSNGDEKETYDHEQGTNDPGSSGLFETSSHLQHKLNPDPPILTIPQDLRNRFELGQNHAVSSSHQPEALPGNGTSGIPGGTANFSYFHHLPMGGLSGTHTPLAAVASGTPFSPMGWHHELPHTPQTHPAGATHPPLQHPETHARIAPNPNEPSKRPSTATSILTSPDLDPISNPSSPKRLSLAYQQAEKVSDDPTAEFRSHSPTIPHLQQSQPSDLQVVARVQYSGGVHMMLTAEILLDYPMPSFVGIPLKLSITGIAFDGVAILAYIKRRMHFCFLGPQDAETLVGDHVTEEPQRSAGTKDRTPLNTNGLIKEIHIESEIGRQESGKQVLKNVGKVEKFVLEQIRRIFEDEFVFPSFWTFLV